jgi:hypothetical protein
MNQWIRSLVPFGVAGVLLAIVAIGFGSSAIQAAKPGTDSSPAEPECNAGTSGGGSLASGKSDSYEVKFCSDPTDVMLAWVSWNGQVNPDRDLALVVTSPSGMDYVVDHQNTTIEYFYGGPNLDEGVWTVEVINVGTRNAKYELSVSFG